MPKAHREHGVLSKNGQNRAYAGAWIETDRVAARFGCALTPHCPQGPMTWTSRMRC